MKMSNETYDLLKRVAMIYFPGFIAFYTTVGNIWGIPCTAEVVATLAAANTFLGVCLGISSKRYNDNNTTEQ